MTEFLDSEDLTRYRKDGLFFDSHMTRKGAHEFVEALQKFRREQNKACDDDRPIHMIEREKHQLNELCERIKRELLTFNSDLLFNVGVGRAGGEKSKDYKLRGIVVTCITPQLPIIETYLKQIDFQLDSRTVPCYLVDLEGVVV